MPNQDRYTQFQNQRALIAGPTYDALIQTRAKHPDTTHFFITTKQLGYAGEPVITVNQSKWQAIHRPDQSIAFVEVQG
jgi:hypothetical protein